MPHARRYIHFLRSVPVPAASRPTLAPLAPQAQAHGLARALRLLSRSGRWPSRCPCQRPCDTASSTRVRVLGREWRTRRKTRRCSSFLSTSPRLARLLCSRCATRVCGPGRQLLEPLEDYERCKLADCLDTSEYADGDAVITEGEAPCPAPPRPALPCPAPPCHATHTEPGPERWRSARHPAPPTRGLWVGHVLQNSGRGVIAPKEQMPAHPPTAWRTCCAQHTAGCLWRGPGPWRLTVSPALEPCMCIMMMIRRGGRRHLLGGEGHGRGHQAHRRGEQDRQGVRQTTNRPAQHSTAQHSTAQHTPVAREASRMLARSC